MNIRRSLPALLAGAVCLVALAASATGKIPAYVHGWSARLDGLLDFTLDRQGRAWLLTRDAFVRLDDQGKVAERIPFTWPADFKRETELQKIFLAVDDDFLVGPYRFDRSGQTVAVYPIKKLWRLAPGLDGTVVHASDKGLDIYDRKGQLVRHADTEPMRPTAVAVDRRGRILVAERERIRSFDRRGRLLRTVDVPLEPRLGGGIESLALDGHGNLHATVFAGSAFVVVLDPELRYLGTVPFAWAWTPRFLAADGRGRLYALEGPAWDRILHQAVPETGSLREVTPRETVLNIPELPPQILPAVGIPVQATLTDSPAWPFRLHVSTRPLRAVAADPKIPGRLWIGGDAGLLRYDTGTGDWQRWTLADGLPDNELRALASDGRRVYLVLARGAAVFDPETGRFRALDLQGEGLTHMAGLRVEPDPGHPGVLWWIAEQGVLRHDVAAESWSYFRNPRNMTLVDGALSGNGRIFVASPEEVWELRPAEREWRRVTNAGILDLASPERREPARPSPITAVSAGDEGRTLWVATDRAGLLRVDTESGRADWPEETRREICGFRRILRQGGRLLAVGSSSCLTEIGPAECCQIDRHRVWEIRGALGDLRQPDLLWLATFQGLFSFRIGDGHLALQSPPWTEPDGVRMSRLLPVEGRLWVAPMNGGVSVLDPATGLWRVLPGLFNVPDLHRSAANGHLLVLRPSPAGGGRELAWIDPKTAEQVLLPIPATSLYTFNDLHHDERGLWVLGRLGDRRTESLALLEPGGATRIVREEAFRSGPDALVPDAAPSHLLAVTGKGELVRIQTETGEMETLRSGVQKIRPADGRHVWIEGRPNARLDLQTRAVAVLDIEGQLFPDPRHPDHGWLLRGNLLALYDIVRGERLAEITLPADEEYEDVTVLGDRVWVGSHIGLLEIPLDALRQGAR